MEELAILILIALGISFLAAIICIIRTNFMVGKILEKFKDIELQLSIIKLNTQTDRPICKKEERKNVVPDSPAAVTPFSVPVKEEKVAAVPPPFISEPEVPVPQILTNRIEEPLPRLLGEKKVEPLPYKKPEFREEKKEEATEFERRASEIISAIWEWIICGESSSKDNVSKEYAIATTWLVRSAVIIIVLGLGFLLKYSIDRNLISPAVRVFLGMLGGVIMLGSGLYIVKGKYRPMALGLCGGGLAVFYFCIYAASSMYKLIDVIPAFALMALVTAAAGLLAVRLNAVLIALVGICGGYLTPVLLNTGVKNFEGLFSYLLLLGVGTIYVARHRDWKLLNVVSFIGTYALFFASLQKFYSKDADFVIVISFLAAFFLLFSAQALIFNIMNKFKSTAIELVMLLVNTMVFLGSAYKLIAMSYPSKYAAIVTISLAVFYIAQIIIFMRKHLNDRMLLITLSGFAGFAIMLTPPILLSGVYITASWALMALAFLWMGRKLDSRFVTLLAYLLYLIATARFIFFDFDRNFTSAGGDYFQGLLNRLSTLGVLIFSYAASWKVLGGSVRPAKSGFAGNDINIEMSDSTMSKVLMAVAAGMLFIFLEFETWHWACRFYPAVKPALMSSVIAVAAFIMFYFAKKTGRRVLAALAIVLAFVLGGKIYFADVLHFWHFSFGNFRYVTDYTVETLLIRLADIVPAIVMLWIFCRFGVKGDYDFRKIFGTAFVVSLFLFLTSEVNTFLGVFLPKFAQGGISILWGVYALSLLTTGVLKYSKVLRYAGLALFSITVIKVFMTDLAALSQLYRIIAFVIVGIVLLGGAFVYIRFKDYFENLSEKISGKDDRKCTES